MSSYEDAYTRVAVAVLGAVPMAILVWRLEVLDDDESFRLVGANPAAEQYSGLDLSQAIGERMCDLFPAARPRYKRYADVVRSGKRASFGEQPILQADGSVRNLTVSAVPLPDQCLVLVFEYQKRVDEEVRELNAFLDSIVDNIPAMVVVKEAKTLRIERFNRAGEELLGIERANIIGRTTREITTPERAAQSEAEDRAALAGRGVSDVGESPIVTRTGTHWLHTKRIPIGESAAGPTHVLSISLDVTQRRESEDELRRSQSEVEARVRDALEARVQERTAELERSNQELQEFAMVASHDLQEPLRKIKMFGDKLIAEHADALGPIGQDYLRRMQSAGARGQSLIQDLLAYARVTSNAKPLVKVDLKPIADEIASDLEARLAQVGGTITIGSLPTIDADPTQMRQLFQNLIGNALKFQRAGVPPSIQVESLESPEAITISVTDNGIGFDEKYTERIFKVFQRLHERSAYEGSGIGLSICRKIAQRHRGTITAKSTLGFGSTFFVRFPPPS